MMGNWIRMDKTNMDANQIYNLANLVIFVSKIILKNSIFTCNVIQIININIIYFYVT